MEKSFFKAVKDGNLAEVNRLLGERPDLIHIRDREASTPLHWAAWKGHTAVVEALLDAGSDIHAHNENDHWGTTPLHAAAHGNNRAAAELLIQRGANVNAVRKSGMGTPLDETRAHNAAAVARLLRAHGATESATITEP
jgi:ankyrin repeat protein